MDAPLRGGCNAGKVLAAHPSTSSLGMHSVTKQRLPSSMPCIALPYEWNECTHLHRACSHSIVRRCALEASIEPHDMSTVRHSLCMRTCGSWAGAVMAPEGKDNIKGQAYLDCTRNSWLLAPIRASSSRVPGVSPLACHAWGLRAVPGGRDAVRQGQREVETLLWE
jgi:hypothetical protein